MKKVIIFSTNYLPNIGGAEVAVKEITDRILQSDFSFVLITPRYRPDLLNYEKIGSREVYRVGFGTSLDKWFFLLSGFFLATKLNKKHNFSIAWSIMASQASISASLFKIFHKSIPLVLTLQEGDEEDHLKRYVLDNEKLYNIFIKPFHHLVFKKADCITAISKHLMDKAKSVVPKTKRVLVSNGVSVKSFSKRINPQKKKTLEGKLGKRQGDIFIVTVSRLVKKNAVGDIIQALTYLPTSFKFLIVGEGQEYNSLVSLSEVYAVRDRVIFAGKVSPDEIPLYLSVSDVFVRPSLSEGFGNSFIEAFAARVPVVGTAVGGIVDFLVHKENGMVVPVKSPRDIAEAVKEINENRTLRNKIVKNAYSLASEKYDWDNIADSMRQVFDQVNIK
ncbi:MAG: hypothetical protein COV70_00245 [Parcubacteria group bacterium CG11_big_fil_rev_8_21_14_0_20_39_22]|nr:MAG: hypothetical protein COV70_00245 [Parcubacteria group bacterium CG11_big_fil_rev_8_21_14_0_20_39_22]